MPKADYLSGSTLSPSGGPPTRTLKAWRSAETLRPGDTVITADGRTAKVKSISGTQGLRTVHNFAVEDYHTYFVGDGPGVWVHNRYGPDDEPQATPAEDAQPDEIVVTAKAADAFTTLTERQVNKLRGANVTEDRIQDVDDLLTQRAETGEQSSTTSNNRKILRALGYDRSQAGDINGLGKDIRRALIDVSPQMIAARAAVNAPGVQRTGNTITGLSLTRDQYILATLDGLWDGLSPTNKNADPTIQNFSGRNNNDVNTAERNYRPPSNISNQEVAADDELRRFVADIAGVTADITPSKNEEFIAVGRNGDGELVVSNIVVLGSGGSLPGSFFAGINLQAIVHTHPKGYVQAAGNLDHSSVDRRSISVFAIGADRDIITEIGRIRDPSTQQLRNMIRRVNDDGSARPWEVYSQNPEVNVRNLGM